MAFELEHEYDVIIQGTGLVESILAAAFTRVGKSVLHLDPNSHYGAHWATFNLKQLDSWGRHESEDGANEPSSFTKEDGVTYVDFASTPTGPGAGFSQVDTVPYSSLHQDTSEELSASDDGSAGQPSAPTDESIAQDLLTKSRDYNIDLTPRTCFCGDTFVSTLVRCGVSRYLEFKAVERCYFDTEDGARPVPCSKSDVFTSTFLSLAEKRHLMKFFQLVTGHQATQSGEAKPGAQQAVITDDELAMPFSDFMTARRVPPRLQDFITYAVALTTTSSKISTREGVSRIRSYMGSLGRYGSTAFLVPFYGVSEWGQAFCRMAAVNGGVYVLNRGVSHLLSEKSSDDDKPRYTGLMSEGEKFTSKHFITSAGFTGASRGSENRGSTGSTDLARAVVVADGPLIDAEAGHSLVSLVIPPTEERTAAYVIQLNQSAGSAPEGKYVLQVTSVLQEPTAKDQLLPIVHKLIKTNSASGGKALKGWFFTQYGSVDAEASALDGVHLCPLPGLALSVDDVIGEAQSLFEKICPDEEFLPAPELTPEEMQLQADLDREKEDKEEKEDNDSDASQTENADSPSDEVSNDKAQD